MNLCGMDVEQRESAGPLGVLSRRVLSIAARDALDDKVDELVLHHFLDIAVGD